MFGHTRRLAAVVVSVLALTIAVVGFAGSANAAPYTTQPTVSVSDQTPVAGQPLTITVSGFLPGEDVRIELRSTVRVLATVRADANGVATATVTLPSDVTGNHTIVAIGLVSGRTASIPITILAPAVNSPVNNIVSTEPGLPRTGVEVVGIGAAATALLIAGGILLLLSGRRRKAVSL